MKQNKNNNIKRALGAVIYTSVEDHLVKADTTAKNIDVGPLCAKVPLPKWNVDAPPIAHHIH